VARSSPSPNKVKEVFHLYNEDPALILRWRKVQDEAIAVMPKEPTESAKKLHFLEMPNLDKCPLEKIPGIGKVYAKSRRRCLRANAKKRTLPTPRTFWFVMVGCPASRGLAEAEKQ
jgi:hypothetical protein